jgi:hypothetical protein
MTTFTGPLKAIVAASVMLWTSTLAADTVVMIGFWPPTNEMLRPWSQNTAQNPGGWQGQNWGGLGHDVYSFFPEFPPDGNPFNDSFGSDGYVGSANSDFRVDYQDTSADFWRVMDQLNPRAVITFSWGGYDSRWEIERVEGGHYTGNADPARDWYYDGSGPSSEWYPYQNTIDARSWDAITTYRQAQLTSQLPVDDIVAAASSLGIGNVFIDETGTSGNYLSGFLALHGLYYNSITPDNWFAGHVHVGSGLTVAQSRALTESTLTQVLLAINARSVPEPSGLLALVLATSLVWVRRR